MFPDEVDPIDPLPEAISPGSQPLPCGMNGVSGRCGGDPGIFTIRGISAAGSAASLPNLS